MKLAFDWLDAPGVADPAEAATWAELELCIGGVLVSEFLDERRRTVRARFCGSALPLAEWLLEAWPRLLHERRVPVEGTDDWWDWRGFHRFRAGYRGGAMPDVELLRFSDDTIELRASADQGSLAPGVSARFLHRARTRVLVSLVRAQLGQFLEAVGGRLADVNTPRAQAFMTQLAAQPRRLEDIAGRLGVRDADAVRAVLESPRPERLAAIIEASVAPSLEARIDEAQAVVPQLPEAPEPERDWRALEEALGSAASREQAWLTGWAAAERFREAVELPPAEPVSGEVLRARCGWDAWGSLRSVPALASGVDTVHVRAPGGPPRLVTTQQTKPAQAFRIARSLYHGLFGGVAPVVADSRLLGSRFSEANAFAAELVAPIERLRQLAPATRVWEAQDVDAASRALGVNPQVVRHQVQNHVGLVGVLGLADEQPG